MGGQDNDRRRVRQAVILAGGKGQRLRPLTDDRPKGMVEVAGTPIVDWQLGWLEANGIDEVVLSLGYKSDRMVDFVSGNPRSITITFAYEPEPLGRGGGLRFAAQSLPHPGRPFIALNGDIITDLDLAPQLDIHEQTGATATLAVVPCRTTWGVIHIDDDDTHITAFEQSPILPYWINAGIYVLEWPITQLLPLKGDHEDSTFPSLAERRSLSAYKFRGYWRGIDTVKDVVEATSELAKLSVPRLPLSTP
jgi:NDP-sugar pyrophosphorylase family protein